MTTDRRRERARRAIRARSSAPTAPSPTAPTPTAPSPKIGEGVELWWPPKRGDRLRYPTFHAAGDDHIRNVQALLHVVAVFSHDGQTHAVTAEWLPGRRRWAYETYTKWRADGLQLHPASGPRSRKKPKSVKHRVP